MLLIFSVDDPVFVSVTFLVPVVIPTKILAHESEVGTRVTDGPFPVIVRLIVEVAVKLPDVPVIVTVEFPSVAPALAVNVRVLVEVVGFGLKLAVTSLGRPVAAKLTLPLNPLSGFTVIVLVLLLPRAMLSVLGFALRVKLGPDAHVLNLKFAMRVLQAKLPVVLLYSCVYQ